MGKNIFIWGIFCVLSVVLFSSCDKEDEEIDNDYTESVTKKQKHLVSSTFYSTDELTNTTYIYDSTSKLTKMSLYNDGKEYDSFNISDTITLDHKGDIVFYISKFDSDGFIAIDSMIWKNVSDNAVTHTVQEFSGMTRMVILSILNQMIQTKKNQKRRTNGYGKIVTL